MRHWKAARLRRHSTSWLPGRGKHQLPDPIAHGRTADIHPWAEDCVLKLFHRQHPPEDVRYEARIARAVHAAGLPVPAVGDVVEIDGRYGLVYERVEGPSMLEELRAKPWTLLASARSLAQLHIGIHSTDARVALPSQRERLERKIREAPGLGPELQQAALGALRKMPGGNRLCHGDFHPGNVIASPRGPVVIDWIDATVGNPLADVARSSVILLGVKAMAGASRYDRMMVGWYHRAYLNQYLRQTASDREDYSAWYPIVTTARMSEGIAEIHDWLRAQAQAGLDPGTGTPSATPRD